MENGNKPKDARGRDDVATSTDDEPRIGGRQKQGLCAIAELDKKKSPEFFSKTS
jgi:hypothetical protein